MGFRARLFQLHRDVGYLALGLTAVYAVSGFAVNHRHEFDSDKVREVQVVQLGRPAELLAPLADHRREAILASVDALTRDEERELVSRISSAVGRTTPPKNAFWRGPDRLSLFFETGERDTVDYQPSTGEARALQTRDRFLLRAVNFLHLNEARRAWTYVADCFAVALLFLAVSGAVMVKGRKGLWGRGGILALLGLLLPLGALLLYR